MAQIAHAHKFRTGCIDNNPFSFTLTPADADAMYFHQAKRQLGWKEFKEAMKEEIAAHVKNRHWTIIPGSKDPNNRIVIRAVWSMKRK